MNDLRCAQALHLRVLNPSCTRYAALATTAFRLGRLFVFGAV
jgi:hypothetical protein